MPLGTAALAAPPGRLLHGSRTSARRSPPPTHPAAWLLASPSLLRTPPSAPSPARPAAAGGAPDPSLGPSGEPSSPPAHVLRLLQGQASFPCALTLGHPQARLVGQGWGQHGQTTGRVPVVSQTLPLGRRVPSLSRSPPEVPARGSGHGPGGPPAGWSFAGRTVPLVDLCPRRPDMQRGWEASQVSRAGAEG